MLKLRLARTGRKKRPSYRIVVTEHTAPRDGRFLEILGQYDPVVDPAAVTLNNERIAYWLSHGAQPTQTVHRLLAKEGLIADYQAKPRSKRADAKAKAIANAAAAAEADAAGETASAGSDDSDASDSAKAGE